MQRSSPKTERTMATSPLVPSFLDKTLMPSMRFQTCLVSTRVLQQPKRRSSLRDSQREAAEAEGEEEVEEANPEMAKEARTHQESSLLKEEEEAARNLSLMIMTSPPLVNKSFNH